MEDGGAANCKILHLLVEGKRGSKHLSWARDDTINFFTTRPHNNAEADFLQWWTMVNTDTYCIWRYGGM